MEEVDGEQHRLVGNEHDTLYDRLHAQLGALATAATAETRVEALNALNDSLQQCTEDEDVLMLLAILSDVTAALKSQLKNANQFVSTKALAVSATLAHFLASAASTQRAGHSHARAVTHALLPVLVDRLADHREQTRVLARSALIDLATASAAASAHLNPTHVASETPLADFQRLLTDTGLHAKLARTKEQTILLLPKLREALPRLTLRPFLPSLVEHLGDADPSVREASRTASIALFSRASPIAKAELKKEMDKHAVRKQTADAILAEVFAMTDPAAAAAAPAVGSAARDRNPSFGHGQHAPSIHPTDREHPRSTSRMGSTLKDTANDVAAVYIASRTDLERALAAMSPHFVGKETEHNWLAREHDIVKIRGMIKTSVPLSFTDSFVPAMKRMQDEILKAAASLRTTLSVHGLALIEELAESLGDEMDPLADGFIGPLLKMAGSTKKLVVLKSQQAVRSILVNVSFRHKFLDLLWQTLQDKTVSSRTSACQHLTTSLKAHADHRRSAFEHHGGLDTMSRFCKKALSDQNKDVREVARETFYQIEETWASVGRSILDALDIATKRQVEANRGIAPSRPDLAPVSAARPTHKAFQTIPKSVPVHSTPRTPGTPGRASDAILAAKRAAAVRLAQERRRQQELEDQLQGAQLMDDVAGGTEFGEPEGKPLAIDTAAHSPLTTTSQTPVHPRSPTEAQSTRSDRSQSSASRIPVPASPGSASPRKFKPSTAIDSSVRQRRESASSATSAQSLGSLRHTQEKSAYGSITQRMDAMEQETRGNAKEAKTPPIHTERESHGNGTVDAREEAAPIGTMPSISQPEEIVEDAAGSIVAGHTYFPEAAEPPTMSNAPAPPQTPVKAAAPPSKADAQPRNNFSTAVKWFLGKASRLDTVNAAGHADELKNASPSKQRPDSVEYIAEVEQGTASLRTFKALVALSKEFKLPENPLGSGSEDFVRGTSTLGLSTTSYPNEGELQRAMTMWQQDELFVRLIDAVLQYLGGMLKIPAEAAPDSSVATAPRDKTREVHTACLVLLHRLVENQYALIASLDRERPMLDVLLDLVQSSKAPGGSHLASSLKSGCQATMEKWADQVDPIVGISLLRSIHLSLLREAGVVRARQGDGAKDMKTSHSEVVSSSVAKWILSLRGLARLFGRLPAEVVEDQLLYCRDFIKYSLDNKHIELRQQAVAVLVTANKLLQDPPSLFAVLSPLDKAQEDLIMYYMSKAL